MYKTNDKNTIIKLQYLINYQYLTSSYQRYNLLFCSLDIQFTTPSFRKISLPASIVCRPVFVKCSANKVEGLIAPISHCEDLSIPETCSVHIDQTFFIPSYMAFKYDRFLSASQGCVSYHLHVELYVGTSVTGTSKFEFCSCRKGSDCF